MLIHKGNFLKRKWTSTLLAAALAGLAVPLPAARGAALAVATVRAPDAVAAEFYGWFLATLDSDQDPLSDRYERLHAYVAQPLVDQLVARGQGAGDYFLQSAHLRGAWLRVPVRTAVLRRQARVADVLVTFDGGGDARHDVVLTMELDNGTWKIRSVSRAAVDAAESSAGRPGI